MPKQSSPNKEKLFDKIRKVQSCLTLPNHLFSLKPLIRIFKSFNQLSLLHYSYLAWIPQHNKEIFKTITRNNKESILLLMFIILYIQFFEEHTSTAPAENELPSTSILQLKTWLNQLYFKTTIKQTRLWTCYKQIPN